MFVGDRSTGFAKTSERGTQLGKEAAHWLLRVFSGWGCPDPFPDQGKEPSSQKFHKAGQFEFRRQRHYVWADENDWAMSMEATLS